MMRVFYLQNEGKDRVRRANSKWRVRVQESPIGWNDRAKMPLKEWEPLKTLNDGLKD